MDLQDKYQKSGIGRIANAISQLGHAIAWGAGDVSISGKTGYLYASTWYWWLNRKVIDFAFYPIDGKDHCKRAYLVDREESYDVGRGIYQDVVCSLFIWSVCPVVAIFGYLFLGIKRIVKKLSKWQSKVKKKNLSY